MATGGKAAATGCYKCGLPGHWSRDCPSDRSQNGDLRPASSSASTFRAAPAAVTDGNPAEKSADKPKKLPKIRPKLTPQILLSDDGLGYVLRHFPRSFKFRGRGHEVSDLSNLIGMYREWHSQLLPYYSFEQFVLKVEKIAATNQVKRCIRELRERVDNGEDPTKLHETPADDDVPNNSQEQTEATNMDGTNQNDNEFPFEHNAVDDMQEDIFNEIFEQAIENPSPRMQNNIAAPLVSPAQKPTQETTISSDNVAGPSNTSVSEEQKSRMEANRLKALERAAARARQS